MNILVIVVLVIAALLALMLIVAFFVKKDYAVKKEIVIDRSLADVFDYVKLLRNQDDFSKWAMMDPQMKKEIRGIDGTVGAIYAWNGNKNAGEGEQEIIDIRDRERVDIEIRFVRPFRSTARIFFVTARVTQSQTRVTWGMEGTSKYPMNLMTAMMTRVLAKDLEGSLHNLKNILERSREVNARV